MELKLAPFSKHRSGRTNQWARANLAIRLNGPQATGKKLVLQGKFTDGRRQYVLTVESGVLNYAADRHDAQAAATLTLAKAALNAVQLKAATPEQKRSSGEAKIDGRREALKEFMGLLAHSPFWFQSVTPEQEGITEHDGWL